MKKYKKIVLAAGTGQIGKALCNHFKPVAEEIIILTRGSEKQEGNLRFIKWDAKTVGTWVNEIDGADVLVNLAGKNVNCRYTEKNKKEIFDSRTHSIEALAKGLAQCKQLPELWVQCASATIYRHAEDRPMTEEMGEIGEGFSVGVCKKWEQTFWEQTEPFKNMRRVVLRTSLVLSKHDGLYPRLKNLTRFGLGGKQGSGRQWISWIHEQDTAAVVEWVANHSEISGVLNCTAPNPQQNAAVAAIMRRHLHMPFGLPSPEWLLTMGAFIIGTETELILKSRWVLPERLLASGFRFKYPDIDSAIQQIANS